MNMYASGEYTKNNPTYHTEHSGRKVEEIIGALRAQGGVLEALRDGATPPMVVEIGCGAGGVIAGTRERLAELGVHGDFRGYDLNPDAIAMAREAHPDLLFEQRDVTSEPVQATLTLMIDFFEHLPDDEGFLRKAHALSSYFLFRIPLDRNAYNLVFRKLPEKREKVGHLHYYTPRTAIELLERCGYKVLYRSYTDNFRDPSNTRSLAARFNYYPRVLLSAASQELNAYVMGGTSLIVIAER